MCYLCTTARATSVCARLHPPAPPARCDKQPALQSNGSAHQCDWKILVHVHAVTSFQEHTACAYVHVCKWEYYALAITGGFMMRVRVLFVWCVIYALLLDSSHNTYQLFHCLWADGSLRLAYRLSQLYCGHPECSLSSLCMFSLVIYKQTMCFCCIIV